MKIAVIAWGSIIGDPRGLKIQSDWDNKGPELEIEFSRVSKDCRLTLVIDPINGHKVKTYYAQSIREDLRDVIADLRDREGTIIKRIGYIDVCNGNSSKSEFPEQIDVFETIKKWCESVNYHAAVWTALPAQFKEQTNMDFSVDNVITYLKNLPLSARNNALNYIRKAPKEVKTPIRREIEQLNYSIKQ